MRNIYHAELEETIERGNISCNELTFRQGVPQGSISGPVLLPAPVAEMTPATMIVYI